MNPEISPQETSEFEKPEAAVFESMELWLARRFEALQIPNAANISREHLEDGTYDQALNRVSVENGEVQ